MTDYKGVVLGKVGDTELTLDDLLFHLKTNLEQHIIDDMVYAVILKKAAEDLGISVSDSELQKAADDFRMDAGLISANETMEWMEERGLTLDEFERKLEHDLLKEKARAAVATEDKVNKIFSENILEFEKAKIGQIVVNDAGLAEEIKTQLDEEEADFATLASKYSTDADSAAKGGFVGFVNRKDLPDEVDVKVFGDDPPELIGPVQADGAYYIVRVLEPKKADPAEPITRASCIELVFDEYMTEKGRELATKLDFLD